MLEHVCTQFPGSHDMTDRTTGRLRCARCQMEASGIGAVAPPSLPLGGQSALLTVSPTATGQSATPGDTAGVAVGGRGGDGGDGGGAGDRGSGGNETTPDGEDFLR
jgi:hypothetical protein